MAQAFKISARLRFQIFNRDKFKCVYCGASKEDRPLTIDHYLPISLGGESKAGNLRTACFECNIGKGTTVLDPSAMSKERDDDKIVSIFNQVMVDTLGIDAGRIRNNRLTDTEILRITSAMSDNACQE